jgi:DNA helicase-2/ATP-dependent DNA helicase PcrA
MFKPRPLQSEVLKYSQGKMGVSAVPGSGKTQTLSYLAAKLIAQGKIEDDQEILVVTLVNSAVNNFSFRISNFMQEFGLIPNFGYRVMTLHGLAHQIVRERPDLVGLDNDFQILDDRESNQILGAAVESWIKKNQQQIVNWTKTEGVNLNDRYILQRWQQSISVIAGNFIRQAKDLQASPQILNKILENLNYHDALISLGTEVFEDYQRALHYRSAVDFDDLIRLALMSLKSDSEYLSRLHYRWPYVLEDEAQDSSKLQEQILELISGRDGNWVRVGDPNQAIYETFTTASPEYLKAFLRRTDVQDKTLPNSGRSTRKIINLANELIRWTNNKHPISELRSALSEPLIKPTPLNDPQPNPIDTCGDVYLYDKNMSATKEMDIVIQSLIRWLPKNQNSTVAILVPRNDRGAKVVEALQKADLPYMEILQTSQSTREASANLASALNFLENPSQTGHIIRLSEILLKLKISINNDHLEEINRLLMSCNHFEEYLYPIPGKDWLKKLQKSDPPVHSDVLFALTKIQEYLVRWQKAAELPIHQLIITIGQDLFENQTDLALTHKLALMCEQLSHNHPEWVLPDFSNELDQIANNRRKVLGFSEEDNGFNPDMHAGKVIVTTYHKAKGLEWDRVYLLSVNNYDFPSAVTGDEFMSERYFYYDSINLEAEAIYKLKALLNENIEALYYEDGIATKKARIEYASERLRLLYVGITRAKKDLVITWNNGDSHRRISNPLSPAIPFLALKAYMEVIDEG